jgi:hypothetical protein
MAATTLGHDLASLREVNPFDRYVNAEYLRLKRKREVFLDHREEPRALLGLVVGVHERLFPQGVASPAKCSMRWLRNKFSYEKWWTSSSAITGRRLWHRGQHPLLREPGHIPNNNLNSDLFINPDGTNNGCQLANPQSLSCAQALTFDLSTLKLVPPFSLK